VYVYDIVFLYVTKQLLFGFYYAVNIVTRICIIVIQDTSKHTQLSCVGLTNYRIGPIQKAYDHIGPLRSECGPLRSAVVWSGPMRSNAVRFGPMWSDAV